MNVCADMQMTQTVCGGAAYLSEGFEAGQLMPVIDGPYKLSDARDAFVIWAGQITKER